MNTLTVEKRATGFDLIKAIAMLGLPFIHTVEEIKWGNAIDIYSTNPNLLLILTAIGPGVFMICMGFAMDSSNWKQLRNLGLHMLGIAFLHNIFRYAIPKLYLVLFHQDYLSVDMYFSYWVSSDIYPLVALSYLTLALFKKWKMSDFAILMTSLLMLTANTLLMMSGIVQIECLTLAAIVGDFIWTNDFSAFPLFCWFIFPVTGVILSRILGKRVYEDQTAKRLCIGAGVFTLALYIALWYFKIDLFKVTVSVANDYITELFNVLVQVGLAFFFIGLLQTVINHTKRTKLEAFLHRMSAFLMPFYFFHWILVSIVASILGFMYWDTYAIPIWVALLIGLVICVVSVLFCERFGFKLMRWLLKVTPPYKKKRKKTQNKA